MIKEMQSPSILVIPALPKDGLTAFSLSIDNYQHCRASQFNELVGPLFTYRQVKALSEIRVRFHRCSPAQIPGLAFDPSLGRGAQSRPFAPSNGSKSFSRSRHSSYRESETSPDASYSAALRQKTLCAALDNSEKVIIFLEKKGKGGHGNCPVAAS